jgi:alpha-galactosidase/6-phospho-beta-glucosidase family protein
MACDKRKVGPQMAKMTAKGNKEYFVKKVMEKRTENNKTEYLLQWVTDPNPSWEPEANLRCADLIRRYEFNQYYPEMGIRLQAGRAKQLEKQRLEASGETPPPVLDKKRDLPQEEVEEEEAEEEEKKTVATSKKRKLEESKKSPKVVKKKEKAPKPAKKVKPTIPEKVRPESSRTSARLQKNNSFLY